MADRVTVRADLATYLFERIRSQSLPAATVELGRNEVIYDSVGDDRSLYLIARGKVKTVVYTRTGKHCVLDICSAGDVLGESCLLGAERLEGTTAITMTETVLRRISCAAVEAALADGRLRLELVKHLTGQLLEQQRVIADLLTENSESRLAAILLRLGRKFGTRKAHLLRIEERITQEELSAMVGTTRSRVGHFLKGFQEAGLVERDDTCFLAIDEQRMRRFLTGAA